MLAREPVAAPEAPAAHETSVADDPFVEPPVARQGIVLAPSRIEPEPILEPQQLAPPPAAVEAETIVAERALSVVPGAEAEPPVVTEPATDLEPQQVAAPLRREPAATADPPFAEPQASIGPRRIVTSLPFVAASTPSETTELSVVPKVTAIPFTRAYVSESTVPPERIVIESESLFDEPPATFERFARSGLTPPSNRVESIFDDDLDSADSPLRVRERPSTFAQSLSESFAAHIVEEAVPVEEGIFVTGRGGPMLTVRLDRKRLATLTRLFSGQNLGMIGHYLVLNALAATDPLPGDASDTTIATFIAQQEQLLSRALITSRLGKVPSPESLAAELPQFPPELTLHAERCQFEAPPPGEALLVRAFQTNEIAFLERTIASEKTSPFLAASRLFVGLCARDAVVEADDVRRSVRDALSAYAALATAEITRIFLRAKLSRTPVPLKTTDRAFDETARTLLAALARLIA